MELLRHFKDKIKTNKKQGSDLLFCCAVQLQIYAQSAKSLETMERAMELDGDQQKLDFYVFLLRDMK